MILYLVPAWAITLVGLWAYMIFDKSKAVKLEKDHCTQQIDTELRKVNDEATRQVNEALEAAGNVVIPDDLVSLCLRDSHCRDK